MNSCWVPHAGSENDCETRKSSKICYFFNINQVKVYRSLSRTSTNWNDAPTASGPLWVAQLLNVLFGEWRSIYVLAFVLEAGILSRYCNKDDVRWHVWLILRDNNCQSRYCLLPFSWSFKYTLNYCVDGWIWNFKFPKVVQAHTLGEVGNLGTVSLRVSSGTILAIFIDVINVWMLRKAVACINIWQTRSKK